MEKYTAVGDCQHYKNAPGQTNASVSMPRENNAANWLGALALTVVLGVMGWAQPGQEAVLLQEIPAVGDQYRVSCRVHLEGMVRLPADKPGGKPQTLPFTGSSGIDYAERILELANSVKVQRTIRIYERMDFQRRLGQQEQKSELRAAVRRMVIVRSGHLEIPFSPDGPLTWSEIDRVRTDVFTPALTGLLPNRPARIGERWQANRASVQELTDLDKITAGAMECRFEQIVNREGRQSAQISFQGTLSGLSEDGLSRHQLAGFLYFDLAQRRIVYVFVDGKQWLLDSEGQPVTELRGQFVLVRQYVTSLPELSDAALRGLKLVPDEDNTRLLFAEVALGVSFVYPRRWTVRKADSQHIVLDEPKGGTVLLTLDPPAQMVHAAQYQQEVERWLVREQAKIHRRSRIEQLAHAGGTLEHFQYEVTVRGERLVLDYYAIRQPGGGATLAGRVPENERGLLADLAVIARSLQRAEPQPPAPRRD